MELIEPEYVVGMVNNHCMKNLYFIKQSNITAVSVKIKFQSTTLGQYDDGDDDLFN